MDLNEEELINQANADGVQQLVVGAIIIERDTGALLVLDREPTDFMGGIEELPSGKVEQGESLLAALARETLEETGLTVAAVRKHLFAFDYTSGSGKSSRQFNFLVEPEYPTNVTVDPKEHTGFRWVELDELIASRLTPNIVTALRSVRSELG